MRLTIGIKAYNEERHIGAALSSAVAAAAPFGGEVILADCGSTDGTVEIAKKFPVRILQLRDPSRRSCGAGAQLAFQHASGAYFYLLDGDMALDPGFLPRAIAFLEENQEFAGVGGRVYQINVDSEEFQVRADTAAKDRNWLPGIVDRLDCGGLYRTAAIRAAGYFADCNLHSFEEFELGVRLRSLGWKLARIDWRAVDHFGHTVGGYRLLWRRLKSGYASGAGELLRSAIGRRHLSMVLFKFSNVRNCIAVFAWWALLIACFALSWEDAQRLALLLALFCAPFLLLAWRRGSFGLGLYSLVTWNVAAFGLLMGLPRRRVSPTEPLPAVTLRQPHERYSP